MKTQRDHGTDEQPTTLFEADYPLFGDNEETDHIIRPINWHTLPADEAEHEWLALNRWVDELRRTYGLPPTIVPPFWYRHGELVWELSALHLHWLNSYDPDASPSTPYAWHRDFADARHRLREWVATCGTRLDRDRPTRLTAWPGETPHQPDPEVVIANRDEDFVAYVIRDVNRRRLTNIRDDERSADRWAG